MRIPRKFVSGMPLLVPFLLTSFVLAQSSNTCDSPEEKCPVSIAGLSYLDPISAGADSAIATPEHVVPDEPNTEHFHWGHALRESFMFLSLEQAYVVKDDYRWVTFENGIPFNHYWRDYKYSLHTWINSGWNDGDDYLYNYVGHPIQGAMTSFIQIQNDPQGRDLEFSNTKAYWWSRFKATMWNAAYSTQWSIGPLSELTVEKYGSPVRTPWNHNGTWPCTEKNCFTGTGQVNLVVTPIGGFGWMLTEDVLDRYVARRVENATSNRFLIDMTRCAVNPIRGGAFILHGKPPWYRPRDRKKDLLIQ